MDDKLLAEAFSRGIISKEDYEFAQEDVFGMDGRADYFRKQIEKMSLLTDVVIAETRKRRQEELQKAEQENRIAVLKAANLLGVSAQVYEQMMLRQAGARADMELEVEKVKRLAQIEIDKVKVMNDNAADREVKLALLASTYEAAKRYYDLRARKASKVEIDNAKRHLEDLEKRRSNPTGTRYGRRQSEW